MTSTVLTGGRSRGVRGHALSEPRSLCAAQQLFTVAGVNRRISTLLVALVPIVAFGVLLALVTVPYVSLGPGPTFDTLGEVDGKQVVDIEGTEVHPTIGTPEHDDGVAARRPDAGGGADAVDVGP